MQNEKCQMSEGGQPCHAHLPGRCFSILHFALFILHFTFAFRHPVPCPAPWPRAAEGSLVLVVASSAAGPADEEPAHVAALQIRAVGGPAAVLVVAAVVDDETEVAAARGQVVVGDARRGVALPVAQVDVVAAVVEEDAQAGLCPAALGASAGPRSGCRRAKFTSTPTELSQPMPEPMIVPS